MAKKLMSVWLSLAVLFFSTITIYAYEDVQGVFLNRNIDINGNRIANYYLEDPLFLYRGTTYFPLNGEMGELLGFKVNMDWESRTIKILKKDILKVKLKEKVLKNNLKDPIALDLSGFTVLTMIEKPSLTGTAGGLAYSGYTDPMAMPSDVVSPADLIAIPTLDVKEVDMKGYCILQVGDVLYIPFRVLTGDEAFGWDVYYDNYSGIYISTDPKRPAATFFDKKESEYNKGLASYIKAKNRSIDDGKSLMLVFLFKHEADVNNIDERLLMAMAQKESTFRTDAVGGSGGPVGILQILPSTAKMYGIERSQLFDPHVNIEFGARYIGEKLNYYDNKTIALTAYNQGGTAVSRGSYNTRYAGRISSAENDLENYLVKNGYGLGE